jgi:predicted NUDIX family NTP pyrophosphohydrolase
VVDSKRLDRRRRNTLGRCKARIRGRDGSPATRQVAAAWRSETAGGKIVHVWAVEDDWEPTDLQSNMFEMEWPPRSGQRQTFSELDRAEWFGIAEARAKILKGQAVFLDRLLTVIADNSTMPPAGRSAQTHRK